MNERPDHVEIHPAKDDSGERTGQFYITKVAPQGETLFTSETYVSHAGARHAAERESEESGGLPIIDKSVE